MKKTLRKIEICGGFTTLAWFGLGILTIISALVYPELKGVTTMFASSTLLFCGLSAGFLISYLFIEAKI